MPKAVSVTEEILGKFFPYVSEFILIPSKGGVFEVTVDGELIFSKKELDRFPNAGEVAELFAKKIPTV